MSKASNFEKRILFAKPVHGKEEIDAVMESLKSGWLGPGEITIKFEKKFNSMIGKKYGVLLNSGSSANLLSVLSLCLPPGSEIITPACTFPTTLNPILQSGCIPVVGDVELNTYNIDISKVEELISSKTRAIIAPHALGSPLDTYKLREICNHHQLKLIEDSCDTVGTKINDHYTGYYGDVGTFSFYASHHLTLGGGGGMIVTDNEEIVKHIKSYKDWGRADEFQKYWTNEGEDFHRRFTHEVDNIFYDSKYTYNHIGYNFKMVEMQAAFGLAQLAKLQEFNKIRDRNVKQLAGFLSDYQDLFILPSYPKHTYPSYLAYPITLQDNAPFARYELLEYLENNGIQTRLLFAGNILRHDAYKNIQYRKAESLANSDKIMRDTFLVGIHQGISEEDMDYMCEIFLGFLKS